MSASRRPINKWWFVVASFISLMVGVNTVNILFNVIGPSLATEFGWTRLQTSTALTIFTIFDGISVLAVGFLIGRFGIRVVSIPVAILFGAGIAALGALPNSVAMLYVAAAIAGCGAGSVGPTVYSVVIGAWFEQHRGLALGIINIGLGLCGTLMPFLIGGLIDAWGWRWAVAVVSLLTALVPTVAYGFVLRMPEQWERDRKTATRQGATAGTSLSVIAQTRQFWLICLAIFFISFATYGVLSQMVSIALDAEFDRTTALSVLSAVSISSIVARLAVGYLLDRVFAPYLSSLIFALCAVGVALITNSPSLQTMYVAAMLVGLGLGAEGDIAAYIVSRYVVTQAYAKVLGIVIFLFAQGGAAGVFALGYAQSIAGSYSQAGWMIVGLCLIASLSMLLLGPYKTGVAHDDGDHSARPIEIA